MIPPCKHFDAGQMLIWHAMARFRTQHGSKYFGVFLNLRNVKLCFYWPKWNEQIKTPTEFWFQLWTFHGVSNPEIKSCALLWAVLPITHWVVFFRMTLESLNSDMAAGSWTTNVIKHHEYLPDKSKLKHSQLQYLRQQTAANDKSNCLSILCNMNKTRSIVWLQLPEGVFFLF